MNNTHTISVVRLYNDAQGVSHFEDIETIANAADFAPPAPKVFVTAPTEAKRHLFLVLPANWFGDAHPVPNRQIMTVLKGELEVRASDGTMRIFKQATLPL